jgi:hypothetical protein
VSEDFDMALRLQCAGYQLRLAAYQGDGFKEGVSLTVYDELARWEKYAYGCNELLFHPIRFWLVRGPFTPLFRKFVFSSMPIGAKLTIMAYIGTYYAIGSAWILTLANYFMMGWFAGYLDQFYLDSFAITFAIIIIFSGFSNVTLAILRYRTNEKSLLGARKSSNSEQSDLDIETNMYVHQFGRTSNGSLSSPSSSPASPCTSPKHSSRTCLRST